MTDGASKDCSEGLEVISGITSLMNGQLIHDR
jgi:hypothetical protein